MQAVWKQAREEAGFTSQVDVAHGLAREFYTTDRICDIRFTPDRRNLWELTPIHKAPPQKDSEVPLVSGEEELEWFKGLPH